MVVVAKGAIGRRVLALALILWIGAPARAAGFANICRFVEDQNYFHEDVSGTGYRNKLEQFLYTEAGVPLATPRAEARKAIAAAVGAAAANPATAKNFVCRGLGREWTILGLAERSADFTMAYRLLGFGVPVNLRDPQDKGTLLDMIEIRLRHAYENEDDYHAPSAIAEKVYWDSRDAEGDYRKVRDDFKGLHGWEIDSGSREQ